MRTVGWVERSETQQFNHLDCCESIGFSQLKVKDERSHSSSNIYNQSYYFPITRKLFL
jgi:hypothetical protein